MNPVIRSSGILALLAASLTLAGCKAQEAGAVPALALPPQAVADVAVVEMDSGPNAIDVLANDIDPSGGGLTVTDVQVDLAVPPMAGSTASTDGTSVSFVPAAGFLGVVTLRYTVADAAGAAASSVVAITVLPLVPPPVALPDVVTVLQDSGATDVNVLANDVDFSGGGLTLSAASVTASLPAATQGVAIVGNALRVTPAAGFVGVVTVAYTATDAGGRPALGLLTVIVSPIALPLGPVPVPDALAVTQDSGAATVDVLANDVDVAGGGLILGAASVTVSVPAAVHGVAIVGNQLRFTPAAGFIGSVVVGYTATDTNGVPGSGVLTVVVSPLALTLGPVPVPDAVVLAQDSGAADVAVLANDIDPAGGGLTLAAASVTASVPSAMHGVAIVGNTLRFTPAAGFAGAVVLGYTAQDSNGNSASGVLNVIVAPQALALGPVPLPDAAVVAQNAAATDIDVLANDVNPAGGSLTLGSLSVTASVPNAAHTLAVAGNKVRFTPAAGFAGAVVVGYRATDANGNFANGVLSITVSPLAPSLAPVAIPDAAVLAQDAPATDINVLANDVDVAGGGLTLTGASVLSTLPAATHAVSVAGNRVRFTPAAGFAGVVVVSYTATDANGQASSGLLGITVTPAALTLPPLAVPDVAVRSSSLCATSINVLANDVDPAGGGLTLTQVSIVTQVPAGAGTVSIVGNQVRYTPSALYVGVVLVSYTATDINGNTTLGELSLTVTL